MCDYSLHHVASRPAKVGDKLVSTQFDGSTTRGFAAVDDPSVAVCILPGTELVFDQEIKHEPVIAVLAQAANRTALGPFSPPQRRQASRSSRRVGISRRQDRSGHPPVSGSSRDGVAAARRHAPGSNNAPGRAGCGADDPRIAKDRPFFRGSAADAPQARCEPWPCRRATERDTEKAELQGRAERCLEFGKDLAGFAAGTSRRCWHC